MKKYITLLVLFLLTGYITFAQNAVLHVSLANSKALYYSATIPSEIKDGYISIPLIPGSGTGHTFKFTHPCFVSLFCADADMQAAKRYFSYTLYLSPGDDLDLKADFNEPGYGITVTGKGSNNNQPLIGLQKEGLEIYDFYKDTVPGRVISKLNAEQRIHESDLEKYIALYKPSPEYIRDWKTDLPYLIANRYYSFKENNKYRIGDAYERNYSNWQRITDSLFAIAKLNNDKALFGVYYNILVGNFFSYERERLLNMAERDPQTFYKQWYNTDTLNGKKILLDDRTNLVHEKIVNKYFSGKSEEYAYALLFEIAMTESAPQNIPGIFERFKSQYPNSDYIPVFAPWVDAVIIKRKQGLTDKMVFVADNGVKLNTLEEVIAAMKGKTVLVDMWGTWCGPCREEIEKHSASIRAHFKGKNLDYLYIANMDLQNSEQWKKLIAYFNIEGTHMLANDSLTKDIMTKVHGAGFPTTFIIKKDGTVEQSKSQYPVDEQILFSQLAAALKE